MAPSTKIAATVPVGRMQSGTLNFLPSHHRSGSQALLAQAYSGAKHRWKPAVAVEDTKNGEQLGDGRTTSRSKPRFNVFGVSFAIAEPPARSSLPKPPRRNPILPLASNSKSYGPCQASFPILDMAGSDHNTLCGTSDSSASSFFPDMSLLEPSRDER